MMMVGGCGGGAGGGGGATNSDPLTTHPVVVVVLLPNTLPPFTTAVLPSLHAPAPHQFISCASADFFQIDELHSSAIVAR